MILLPANRILALDTATPAARIAVLDGDGAVLASRQASAARHSSNLLRLVDEALGEVGLRPGDLDAIACGAGPGSFTGLRVGMAVAKGLALASSRPLVLVSSLAALARDLLRAGPAAAVALAAIDAGKGRVYGACFAADPAGEVRALTDEWDLAPAELCARVAELPGSAQMVWGGNGAERFATVFEQALAGRGASVSVPGPSAEAVGALALLRLRRGEADDLAQAVPSYGRPPDITKPRSAPGS